VIVEYIRYEVAQGREDDFLQAYREAAAALEGSPHSLSYEVAQCVEEPGAFVVRLEWDSAEGHLEGFRKGPTFPAFMAAVGPFFNDIQEMRHYERTAVHSDAGRAVGS